MAYKGNEGMVYSEGLDDAGKAVGGNLYIKGDTVYGYGKKDDGTEVKVKTNISNLSTSTLAQYSSNENALGKLSDAVKELGTALASFEVKKSGSNYKFFYEADIPLMGKISTRTRRACGNRGIDRRHHRFQKDRRLHRIRRCHA